MKWMVHKALANQARAQPDDDDDRFRVTSSKFANDTILPISAIDNIISRGVHVCSRLQH